MIDREEWSTINRPTTSKTTTWSVSVCLLTRSRSGFHPGLQRLKRKSTSLPPGSQEANTTRSSLVQPRSLTGIGPTTPPELRSDASSLLPWSEKCQSRVSTLDLSLHTSTSLLSYPEELEEVSDSKDPSWCTIISSIRDHFSTTQTCSGGILEEFCQRTHQCQTPIQSGDIDRLQSIISITRRAIDTEWESQDTSNGMAHRTSQLCHSFTTLEPMSLTVPSRETAVQPLSSDDSSR